MPESFNRKRANVDIVNNPNQRQLLYVRQLASWVQMCKKAVTSAHMSMQPRVRPASGKGKRTRESTTLSAAVSLPAPPPFAQRNLKFSPHLWMSAVRQACKDFDKGHVIEAVNTANEDDDENDEDADAEDNNDDGDDEQPLQGTHRVKSSGPEKGKRWNKRGFETETDMRKYDNTVRNFRHYGFLSDDKKEMLILFHEHLDTTRIVALEEETESTRNVYLRRVMHAFPLIVSILGIRRVANVRQQTERLRRSLKHLYDHYEYCASLEVLCFPFWDAPKTTSEKLLLHNAFCNLADATKEHLDKKLKTDKNGPYETYIESAYVLEDAVQAQLDTSSMVPVNLDPSSTHWSAPTLLDPSRGSDPSSMVPVNLDPSSMVPSISMPPLEMQSPPVSWDTQL